MKVIFINSVINIGSTGKIVKKLKQNVIKSGGEAFCFYGRKSPKEKNDINISNSFFLALHIFLTRLFDLHGNGSVISTIYAIYRIKRIKPDIIHLHNLHGYYINYKILFKWLSKNNIPIVWTLHDCWSYTGHCAYYSFVNCEKWKHNCEKCNFTKLYPKSIIFKSTKKNLKSKKKSISEINRINLVVPSIWLYNEIKQSFMKDCSIKIIPSGVDLSIFYPRNIEKNKEYVILCVANIWEDRKGLSYVLELSKRLSNNEHIVIIGLDKNCIAKNELINKNKITCIPRTQNQNELAEWYSKSTVYFNASIEETQGLTTIEAMACGTPCIVFNETAIPEAIIHEKNGYIVDQRNLDMVYEYIKKIEINGKNYYKDNCVNSVKQYYDQNRCYKNYIDLYNEILRG